MTEGLFISCSAVRVKPNRRAGLRRRSPAFLLSANQKTRVFALGSSPRCGPRADGEEASSCAWVSRAPRAACARAKPASRAPEGPGSRKRRGGEAALASARPATDCLRSGLAVERRRKPNSRRAPALRTPRERPGAAYHPDPPHLESAFTAPLFSPLPIWKGSVISNIEKHYSTLVTQ